MRLSAILNTFLAALVLCATAFSEPGDFSGADRAPVNQLLVAGNACGPAALLNSFRFSAGRWRQVEGTLKGNTDKDRMLALIRGVGMRPSKNLPGRPRWSRAGVGVSDLRDMANESITGWLLPPLNDEVFFIKPGETPERLLARVHGRLAKSLKKGFPPVISLRRHALRAQKTGPPQWVTVDAHFVTLTSIPDSLAAGSREFAVSYIDPWGGRRESGIIRIPDAAMMPSAPGRISCLEAVFPKTLVGARVVRMNEKSFVAVAASIGNW